MKNEGFVFYKTFLDTINSIPDEDLQNKLNRAIVNYGITGQYDTSNEMVNAFMQQIIFLIDRSKNNYEKSIQGGKKTRFNHEEIKRLCIEGWKDQEIADEIGCSIRTVQRVRKDEVKKSH